MHQLLRFSNLLGRVLDSFADSSAVARRTCPSQPVCSSTIVVSPADVRTPRFSEYLAKGTSHAFNSQILLRARVASSRGKTGALRDSPSLLAVRKEDKVITELLRGAGDNRSRRRATSREIQLLRGDTCVEVVQSFRRLVLAVPFAPLPSAVRL